MCGIFGATDRKQFLNLYQVNQDRGSFSFGAYIPAKDLYCRAQGVLIRGLPDTPEADLYLGHTRAPTGAGREFDPANSPPFVVGDWVVGHNGIISNFEELKQLYVPSDLREYITIDSQIIPFLFTHFKKENKNMSSIACILNTIKLLDGIFACWAFNKSEKSLFLFRCASPIFYQDSDKSFSSTSFEDAISLEEGVLYRVDPEGLYGISNFPNKTPFYIPE